MVRYAAISYAAADFAVGLSEWRKRQVEQIRDIYINRATFLLGRMLDHKNVFNREDVTEIGYTAYLLLSCAVFAFPPASVLTLFLFSSLPLIRSSSKHMLKVFSYFITSTLTGIRFRFKQNCHWERTMNGKLSGRLVALHGAEELNFSSY